MQYTNNANSQILRAVLFQRAEKLEYWNVLPEKGVTGHIVGLVMWERSCLIVFLSVYLCFLFMKAL